jgi:hypothetical protein
VRGIVNEDLVDLTQRDQQQPRTGRGHALLRPGLDPRQAGHGRIAKRIFKVLRAHEIEQFYYIGGNDSADTVRIVSEQAQRGRLSAALHPHPEDHRQRPGRQRPHAGFSLGGALSSPRPLPAPTSTTLPCPACMSAW